jgi:tRNA (guanine10-N2)-dimethyltransferase
MDCIFVLSKENLPLARLELNALFGNGIRHYNNVSLLSTRRTSMLDRPAYARSVWRHLFSCRLKDIEQEMASYKWQAVYRKSFSVRVHGRSDLSEGGLAGFIWRSVYRPRVDLRNACTQVGLFVHGHAVHAGLLLHRSTSDFESRKAHKRPRLHPSSMHPKLSRAMVNLTGITRGALHDPFCGSGGILIEAGLMGLKAIGYDIDDRLIERAEHNLRHYDISGARLAVKDSTKLRHGMRYIATDLPYGRNTKKEGMLYKRFFAMLSHCLTGQAVIGIPAKVRYKSLMKGKGLCLDSTATYYIHKSLTKRILVISSG